jgi:hypothetical protein
MNFLGVLAGWFEEFCKALCGDGDIDNPDNEERVYRPMGREQIVWPTELDEPDKQ